MKEVRKKKKKESCLDKLSRITDIPAAVFTGGFRIEVFENKELTIENHRGIIEYGTETIRVSCSGTVLKIEGQGLNLVAMNSGALWIKGTILSISYSN